jgi:hypothetical protein
MKYLRKFNEGVIDTQEIEDLCNEYLAYLKDDNFEINIKSNNFIYGISITIEKSDNSVFEWEDVKYDLLPFIEELLKNWKLNEQPSFVTQKNPHNTLTGIRIGFNDIDKDRNFGKNVSLDTILDDDFSPINIVSIDITVYK